jgi:hypothetical protein
MDTTTTTRGASYDEDAARELELYTTNVAAWIAPVVKTLSKKWRQGVFDYGRAVAYVNRYALVPAAKQYKMEYGSMATSWHQMFDKPTRDKAAESIVAHWVEEFKLGNFWD